jgi:hypothetical protein
LLLGGCSAAPGVPATAPTSGAAAANTPAAGSSTSAASSAATSGAPAGQTAGASAASGASAGGACALATQADVADAYGEPFDAGQPSSPGGFSACLFKQAGGGIDTVTLTLADSSQADVAYSTNRTVYDATDVPGLGDKAFISNDGGMIGVEGRSSTILVHTVGFEKDSPAQLQSKQKAFVQKILARGTR